MPVKKYLTIRIAGALLAAAYALVLGSCDILRDNLSSELSADLEEKVGTALLSGTTWYYDGSADTDMSASADSALLVGFTKKVRISETGVEGRLTLAYTDAAGSSSEKTLGLAGGSLAQDGRSYSLDMAGVTAWLDGTTIPSGTADLTVSLTGFVCDEGDGKDRALPRFERRVMIAPLFSGDPAAEISFSTIYSTAGKAVSIPAEAPLILDSSAAVSVAAHAGSALPAGFDSADLALSLAQDSRSLVLTPSVELLGENFVMDVTVSGFRAPLSGAAMERTFTVSCNPVLIAFDGVKDGNWEASGVAAKAEDAVGDAMAGGWAQAGNEAAGLWVTNDGTYLYLAMAFDSLSNMWNDDRIVFMIDDVSREGGATARAGIDAASDWIAPASAFTAANGQADIYLFHNPGGNGGSGQGGLISWADDGTLTSAAGDNWTASPVNWSCSAMGWANPNGPSFVEYRIALSAVGLSAGSSIRVFGTLSNYWSADSIHATDIVPGAAPAASDNVTYDFAAALAYTVK